MVKIIDYVAVYLIYGVGGEEFDIADGDQAWKMGREGFRWDYKMFRRS